MPNVVVPNYKPFVPGESFSVAWQLTRALLAAGWKYKASSDVTGAVKETTGNAAFDRWAVGGAVNTMTVSGQSGTTPTIGAVSNGVSTITGLSGMSSTLSPGRHLQFTNAANANNNGNFRIVAYVSATSVTIWNPGAVAETGTSSVLWAEKEGGNTASIAAAGTAGAIPGRAILTGLTGMVAAVAVPLNRGSAGDRITIINATTGANNGTFMITRVISSTSVEIDNASAVSDANNGAIRWVEVSPTAQVYAAHLQGGTGVGGWLVLQGPSTMKIPIGTNVPTGAFVRGENVTQTTTGAQGEILGVVTDTSGGLGFLVVQPRVGGTGAQATGPRGWNASANTDTITGGSSGATVTTPVSSTPVEFVREHVYWKAGNGQGHLFMQCIDQASESASRFTTLTSGATTILAPGGATGTFPTPGSYVSVGTGASNLVGTGYGMWFQSVPFNGTVNISHVMCANCIEGTGISADGTWMVTLGAPTGNAGSSSSYMGSTWSLCDNSEDGDVDPYVSSEFGGIGSYNMNGTTRLAIPNLYSGTNALWTTDLYSPNSSYFGWRRRGFSSGDAYQQFQAMSWSNGNGGFLQSGFGAVAKVACSPDRNVFVKQPIWIISTQLNSKMRKGTLKHLFSVEGGVAGQTYQNGTLIQFATCITNSSAVMAPPMVCDLWDGVSVAVNG